MIHRIGNIYKEKYLSTYYLLSRIDDQNVALISLANGNRWNPPIKSKLIMDELTNEEWIKLQHGREFIYVTRIQWINYDLQKLLKCTKI